MFRGRGDHREDLKAVECEGKSCSKQEGNRVGHREIMGRNQVNQTMGKNKSRKKMLPEQPRLDS